MLNFEVKSNLARHGVKYDTTECLYRRVVKDFVVAFIWGGFMTVEIFLDFANHEAFIYRVLAADDRQGRVDYVSNFLSSLIKMLRRPFNVSY